MWNEEKMTCLEYISFSFPVFRYHFPRANKSEGQNPDLSDVRGNPEELVRRRGV